MRFQSFSGQRRGGDAYDEDGAAGGAANAGYTRRVGDGARTVGSVPAQAPSIDGSLVVKGGDHAVVDVQLDHLRASLVVRTRPDMGAAPAQRLGRRTAALAERTGGIRWLPCCGAARMLP